jgi:hypothetical protein
MVVSQVTDDVAKYGESTQKMSGYFEKVASRKRSAAAGQVSDAGIVMQIYFKAN